VKSAKIVVEIIPSLWFPRLSRRRKVDEDSMVELRGWIGVEEYLAIVPVALADICDVEDAGSVTTALDLRELVDLI